MNARVVELVDTSDLKSDSPNGECGFDPRPGYNIWASISSGLYPVERVIGYMRVQVSPCLQKKFKNSCVKSCLPEIFLPYLDIIKKL